MKLSVTTKVFLLLLANLAFLFRVGGVFEASLVTGLLLLLWSVGQRKLAFLQGLFYLLACLLDSFLLTDLLTWWWQLPATFVRISRMMMPSIIAGSLLVTTTTAYQLLHGLRKWRLPESLLLTLAVMLRFLPTIRQDARILFQSLQIRGIFLTKRSMLRHPLSFFEYMMMPLLLSLLRHAEELTMAVMTKGLARKGQVTETFVGSQGLHFSEVLVWIGIGGMGLWLIL